MSEDSHYWVGISVYGKPHRNLGPMTKEAAMACLTEAMDEHWAKDVYLFDRRPEPEDLPWVICMADLDKYDFADPILHMYRKGGPDGPWVSHLPDTHAA